jgi:hypothetical protein
MLVIPENPKTAGQLHVDLDLSIDEWKDITSRLFKALSRLRAQNAEETSETPR